MKTKLILLILILFALNANAQVWQWAKAEPNDVEGNSYTDYDDAHHSAVDANGNLYVLGDYNDSLYLDGIYRTHGNGSYLAKYNSIGSLLWYQLITSYDNLYGQVINATSLVVNKNGIFLTGFLPQPTFPFTYKVGTSDFFVDSTGYNGNYGYLYGNQFFLCHLNSSGNVLWNKTSRKAWINSRLSKPVLATDKNNNIIVSGVTYRQNCCGDFNRNKTFYLGNDAITDDYSIKHNFRLFSLKYNSGGTLLWNSFAHTKGSTIQDPDYLEVISSAVDSSNNILLYVKMFDGAKFGNITFSTSNITSSILSFAKLNATGNWTIVKEVSTYSDHDEISSNKNQMLTTDSLDNVYVLTNLYTDNYLNGNILVTFSDQNPKMFLLKYNSLGNLLWYKSFGGIRGDMANSVVCKNNSLYLSGFIRSGNPAKYTLNFSPLTVNDEYCSYNDIAKYFIAKADTSGSFTWVNFLCAQLEGEGFSNAIYNDNIYTSGLHLGGVLNLGYLTSGLTAPSFDAPFTGKLKDQYIRVGSVTLTTLCPGSNITIPFTSYGLIFSNKNKFTAELSDSNGDFTNPQIIGSVKSTGSGSIIATIPANLLYGSGYIVRIKSSDTLATGYNYYAYADTPYKITLLCPAPSSGFKAANITASTATLSWNAVDCAKGYKLQYRIKGTNTWITAPLITTNTPTLNLSGLSASTTYQWRVSTKCKPLTFVYSAYSNNKEFTTTALALAINNSNTENISLQPKAGNIILSPNPAMSNITIQFTSNQTGKYLIELTDMLGKVLQTKNGITTIGENKLPLDVSKYAQGMYFIKLTYDEHERRILKFNKE